MPLIRVQHLVLGVLVCGLTACGNGSGTGRVTLLLANRASSMATAGSVAHPAVSASVGPQDTIQLGGDEIVLDQVEIVLRKVKFEGVSAETCTSAGDTGPAAASEDCGEFHSGPELFDLPLDPTVQPTVTATVPVGSYRGIQFQIHRPTNANEDAAFLASHPGFDDVSIRVAGSYRRAGELTATPFTYTTGLTSVITVELDQPLAVTDGGTLAVTLALDPAGWFRSADRSGLVDPAAALSGQPFQSLVEQNIRQSFQAFEDENQDGEAD